MGMWGLAGDCGKMHTTMWPCRTVLLGSERSSRRCPTWEAAKAGGQAASNGGNADGDSCAICGVSTLRPNGTAMRDVLVCNDCQSPSRMLGFKKVPRGPYKCGCRGGVADDDLEDDSHDGEDDDGDDGDGDTE